LANKLIFFPSTKRDILPRLTQAIKNSAHCSKHGFIKFENWRPNTEQFLGYQHKTYQMLKYFYLHLIYINVCFISGTRVATKTAKDGNYNYGRTRRLFTFLPFYIFFMPLSPSKKTTDGSAAEVKLATARL
jgi:hypothetical protein